MPIPTRSQSLKIKARNDSSEKPTRQIQHVTNIAKNAGQRLQNQVQPDQLSSSSSDPATQTSNVQKIQGASAANHVRNTSTTSAIPTRSSTASNQNITQSQLTQSRLKPQTSTVSHERNPNLSATIRNSVRPRVTGPVNKSNTSIDRQSVESSIKSTSKPQFSTYQQHSTSRKVTQTSQVDVTSCIETATKVYEENCVLPGVARLQDELLQLSLVYTQSAESFKSYERHVNDLLKKQGILLSDEVRRSNTLKMDRQRNINVSALKDWLGSSKDTTASDKIRILSGCIQNLGDLHDNDGSLSKALAQFDDWYQDTASLLDHRSYSGSGDELQIVQPLNADWQQTITLAKEKLKFCLSALDHLELSQNNSCIWLVYSEHIKLAKAMQAELDTCLHIYQRVMIAEEAWIDTKLKTAMSAAQLHSRKPPRQALWE